MAVISGVPGGEGHGARNVVGGGGKRGIRRGRGLVKGEAGGIGGRGLGHGKLIEGEEHVGDQRVAGDLARGEGEIV